MKNRFKKSLCFIKDLTVHFSRDLSTYFYKGWKAGLMSGYTYSFIRSLIFYLNQFRIYLYIGGIQHHHIHEDKIKRLQKTTHGLHTLLPKNDHFSYSILMAVNQPRPHLFQESLESALNQSAIEMDVLVGLMHPPSKKIEELLVCMHQKWGEKLIIFNFFHILEKEEVINQLAEKTTRKFLLILEETHWIRPDFLFRFEQTLRIFPDREKKIIYCHLNEINDKGYFIPNSEQHQSSELLFPYFFKPMIEKGMLIPTALWKNVGGIDLHAKGAEYEQLLLKFDLAGATFQQLPLSLYSVRSSSREERKRSQASFLQVLEDYSKAKQLNWQWSPGYLADCVRAQPPLPSCYIQVVIPYKDQKELTLKCIHSLLQQKEVQFQITAIDNGSTDPSIASEIEKLGGEVISICEPFNYSRLNNLAVQMTQQAAHCEIILFLNNDVELESDAMSEMVRWVHQPQVGMVGCRLHYPDGRLQHGGVGINLQGREEIRWEHIEKLRRFKEMKVTKTLGFFDAVTAACVMMKRKTFLEVGGFDEIWYPIGYSDTHLALKVASQGLKCFYTPYAVGVHHESISRKSSIEDYENSWWLHHLLMKRDKFNNNELEKNNLNDFC